MLETISPGSDTAQVAAWDMKEAVNTDMREVLGDAFHSCSISNR